MQLKITILLLLLGTASARAQVNCATFPPAYQGLCNQFVTVDCAGVTCVYPTPPGPPPAMYLGHGDLNDFQSYVLSLGSGPGGTLLTGQLTAVNAGNGPGILDPSVWYVAQREIAAWQAMGAKAMAMEILFPMLYQPFLDRACSNCFAQFSALYAGLAQSIRAHGMKVVVESQTMLSNGINSGNWPTVGSFYAALQPNFMDYVTARAATIANVANIVQPDYYVMQEEPQTEAAQTGQPTNSVVNSLQMLTANINSARAAIAACKPGTPLCTMKIGAGLGPWQQTYINFVQAFTHQPTGCMVCLPTGTNLDFLDLHMFPINETPQHCSPGTSAMPGSQPCTYGIFWWNYIYSIMLAHSGTCSNGVGCQVSVAQSWLRKNTNADWQTSPAGPACGGFCDWGNLAEGREFISSFLPLDYQWIQTMWAMANHFGFAFWQPFDTPQFTSYVAYSACSGGSCNGTGNSGTCAQGMGSGCNIYPDGDGCAQPCGNFLSTYMYGLGVKTANALTTSATYNSLATQTHDLIAGLQASAPSVPNNVLAIRTSSTSVLVTWLPSTDPIGVAGYQIQRDGTTITTLVMPPYTDTADCSPHTYAVRAFNLGSHGTYASSVWSPISSVIAPQQFSQ